jgi:PcRGLX-like protein C-terminal alpha/alpha toroid domain
MTRHTGEVDVYHIGPYRGFGTRHGVQHWSDSSKQPRISNAAYRRFYFYLTADERVGDLMHELIHSDETLVRVDIERKLDRSARAPLPAGAVESSFGTSWCSFLAAWLTQWERTGDVQWRDRILAGMTSIAALPKGWFAGIAAYDLATGRFLGPGDRANVSHLNAVFGAVEINSELLGLIDAPGYREAWLDYCRYYNAPSAELDAHVGAHIGPLNLREGHSRLTAYAARQQNDAALAARAWEEFFSGEAGQGMLAPLATHHVGAAAVLEPIEEDPRITTNTAAQWGLAAIQNLALIGQALESAAPH